MTDTQQREKNATRNWSFWALWMTVSGATWLVLIVAGVRDGSSFWFGALLTLLGALWEIIYQLRKIAARLERR